MPLRALRLLQAAEDLTAAPNRSRVGIKSPWSSSHLAEVLWSDIFGVEHVPVNRAEAMAVPAVAKGRHLIVSTIAKLPLRTYKGASELSPQPLWLHRTNGRTSPQHRMCWTVDDLIFSGWSLWGVQRGEGQDLDGMGPITDAQRIPPEMWSFDGDGQVLVNDEPVEEGSAVLIPGFHEGLLEFARRTIRGSRQLEETVASRAGNPTPSVELHQTTDDQLEDEEIQALLDAWRVARMDPGGAVAYTPSSIDVRVHGQTAADLLIEAGNQAAIDVARALGMPAAMLDATRITASLTYETQEGRSNDFIDFSLPLYMTPITSHLSMDDCTPRGTRIAFDAGELTGLPRPTGPVSSD